MRKLRGLAGLASVGAVLLVGAMAPSTALAHPCITEVEASIGSTLNLHNGGTWAGSMPSFTDLKEECADDVGSYLYRSVSTTTTAADPVEEAVETFAIKNLTPLGYTARNVPYSGTGSSVYNSDLAFKDNLVIAGTYEGFRIIDFTDKANPVQIVNYTGCTVGQGDVVVYGNILIRSWDSPANASAMCAGQLVGQGFEGIHIFDISNPAQPQMIRQLRMAATGNEEGAPTGCGSHTATLVPDAARGNLYIYNGASSGSCRGIDIVRINLADPTDAVFLRRVSHEVPTRSGNNSCHDNNVLLNVGGTSTSYAMCAGGNGLAMYKFDLTLPADAEGGVERPTLLWSQSMGVSTGHSGSFTYDGKYLLYGHEPGGGSQAQCQATSSITNRTLFFIDPETGETKGTMLHPRPQTAQENCTWHNFNVIPTKAGYYASVGSYQSGISVFDFSNPAAPKEVAYADPAPLSTTGIVLGGDWSTYWHNGYIYESDIRRGVISWQLNLAADASVKQADEHLKRTNTFALSNPQTQAISYQPENELPTVSSTLEGATFKQGETVAAAYTCADNVAVDSCEGSVAVGEPIDTSTLGIKTIDVEAIDSAGNIAEQAITYAVTATDVVVPAAAVGSVDTILGLTIGEPATFAKFVPGIAQAYTASTVARLTTTTGDVALSVSDTTGVTAGRLRNGTFALSQPLSVTASGGGGAITQPGGTITATPTALIGWASPQTNRAVTLNFTQNITATETLRSGEYAKELTFSLETTAP